MRVVLSDRAESDLEEIGDWIACDSPRRAVSFVQELRGSCAALAANPLGFERVERFGAHELRRRVHGRHLIFYVVRGEQVAVLRIVHGARDYESLLAEDRWLE